MSFIDKIKDGMKKTRDNLSGRIDTVLNSFTRIDDDLMDELEETLILADIGVETASAIIEELKKRIKTDGIKDTAKVKDEMRAIIAGMLSDEDEGMKLGTKPAVILVIGVNGVGKTTTIGKLAHNYTNMGKKVLLAAGDTFRAAAADQLEIWANRAGADIVRHSEGADPAAVVFDSVAACRARECDLLICDTAGRLHNKQNLMNELAKINRVLEKELPGCDKEVLLVIDATTGQNALAQAKQFRETAGVTGIVLTKLDGTAKGGVVVSVRASMGIPIRFIGVGEGIDDLMPFDPESFASAIIG